MKPELLVPILTFPPVERIVTSLSVVPINIVEGSIHLWGFSLEEGAGCVERCRAVLSHDEQSRVARFVRHEHRISYVLSRGGLRAVLARYVGVDPSALMFQSGPNGKPLLVDGHGRPDALKFNLAHSHGRMVVAVAQGREVGVDLERIRAPVDVSKLSERFYASEEHERIMCYSGFERARMFYRYWVAKEAVLKGQAVGLRALQQCAMLFPERASKAVARVFKRSSLESGWTVRWLDCGAEWEGAVAARGDGWTVEILSV